MNKWAHSVFLVVLAAGFFLAGAWYNQRATVKGGVHEGRRILYYQDPMHPAYKSDKPGIAPDCGMRLEPVYADVESESRQWRDLSSNGLVHITARQQRSIGLQTETVTPTAGALISGSCLIHRRSRTRRTRASGSSVAQRWRKMASLAGRRRPSARC